MSWAVTDWRISGPVGWHRNHTVADSTSMPDTAAVGADSDSRVIDHCNSFASPGHDNLRSPNPATGVRFLWTNEANSSFVMVENSNVINTHRVVELRRRSRRWWNNRLLLDKWLLEGRQNWRSNIVLLETFSPPQIGAIFKHVEGVRIQCPIAAFTTFVRVYN